jgi:multidrug efflux pump subunit AcrB
MALASAGAARMMRRTRPPDAPVVPFLYVWDSSAVTSQAALSAVAQLVLMLAVVAVYIALARRFRLLWQPLSIVVAVGIVGVLVSVITTLIFGGGIAAVPAMARRSAIGGFGWGLVIATIVWICRRGYAWWVKA